MATLLKMREERASKAKQFAAAADAMTALAKISMERTQNAGANPITTTSKGASTRGAGRPAR
eukprot:6134249-Karenia_brevis.AAC.1